MGIVNGKKLMCFLKDNDTFKAIGFCTNHTFSTSASTVDIAHKDLADAEGNGKWADEDVDTFSWTITSESFYANEAEGYTANELFALYAAGTTVDCKFGLAPNNTAGAPDGGWTPQSGTQMLSGKAIITSLDINASVSEKATFSITLTGKGPVKLAA